MPFSSARLASHSRLPGACRDVSDQSVIDVHDVTGFGGKMRDNREFEFRHPFQRPHDSSGRVIRIQNLCLIRASRLIIRGLFVRESPAVMNPAPDDWCSKRLLAQRELNGTSRSVMVSR